MSHNLHCDKPSHKGSLSYKKNSGDISYLLQITHNHQNYLKICKIVCGSDIFDQFVWLGPFLDKGSQRPDPPVQANNYVHETWHEQTARVVEGEITVYTDELLSVLDDGNSSKQNLLNILKKKDKLYILKHLESEILYSWSNQLN